MVDKNQKPEDNLDKIKRQKSKFKHVTSPADEIELSNKRYKKIIKEIKKQSKKIRDNFPPIRVWFIDKIKQPVVGWFKNAKDDFLWYLDSKVDLMAGEVVRQVTWVVLPIIILVVIAMLIRGC